ncbi:hypothetical protein TNCV_4832811 [Trichonephila clavipes]|nr:hypothetical protein TNCV_4832811 [Trichonephila clavipes]
MYSDTVRQWTIMAAVAEWYWYRNVACFVTVHKALGEAKNSVFQEETLLSQARRFQWDNDIAHILASCLFGKLIHSIIAEISAMAPNIKRVDVAV